MNLNFEITKKNVILIKNMSEYLLNLPPNFDNAAEFLEYFEDLGYFWDWDKDGKVYFQEISDDEGVFLQIDLIKDLSVNDFILDFIGIKSCEATYEYRCPKKFDKKLEELRKKMKDDFENREVFFVE